MSRSADATATTGEAARREVVVSRAFVALADTLVDDYDVIELLARLVGFSVELLAAEAAGLVLADGQGRLRVVAASSEAAELMELLQLHAQEGPCLDCFSQGARVSVADLREAGQRWPAFAAAVARHEAFRSVHAIPLRLRGDTIGALNLFHRQPGSLPETDLALGQAMADVATIGILQERSIHRTEVLTEQLQVALHSRIVIEQAKGALAQYGGLPMDVAFNQMRQYSRNRNQRLAEVARTVIDGQLDLDALLNPAPAPRADQA